MRRDTEVAEVVEEEAMDRTLCIRVATPDRK